MAGDYSGELTGATEILTSGCVASISVGIKWTVASDVFVSR